MRAMKMEIKCNKTPLLEKILYQKFTSPEMTHTPP
jgi:hypothetical protein